MIFDPHTKTSIWPPHKILSISVVTETKSNSIPHQDNQVDFSRPYWHEVNLVPTLESSLFRCLHTKTKLTSIRITSNQVFLIPTQKQTQFRSPDWSQVNLDAHYNIKTILMPRNQNQGSFDAYTKTQFTSTTSLKSSPCWSLHRNQVKFDPHKLCQFRYNETQSLSTPTPKPSECRSLHRSQVDLDVNY